MWWQAKKLTGIGIEIRETSPYQVQHLDDLAFSGEWQDLAEASRRYLNSMSEEVQIAARRRLSWALLRSEEQTDRIEGLTRACDILKEPWTGFQDYIAASAGATSLGDNERAVSTAAIALGNWPGEPELLAYCRTLAVANREPTTRTVVELKWSELPMTNGVDRFEVEIEFESVLRALSTEIYATPHAFLRENLQNAIDACRMQAGRQKTSTDDPSLRIDITVSGNSVQVRATAVTVCPLRICEICSGELEASGKRTEEAREAGCVGRFGIGGFANFGVCETLIVHFAG